MLLVPVVGWLGWIGDITLASESNGSVATITLPGGLQAGDFCVIYNTARSNVGTLPSDVTPSGFTQIRTAISGSGAAMAIRSSLFAKVLNGTETTVTGLSGTTEQRWCLGVFRGAGAIAGFTSNDVDGEATLGDPASQTLTSGSAATVPALAIGFISATTALTGTTASPTPSAITSGTSKMLAYYSTLNTVGSLTDYTFDVGDLGGDDRQSIISVYFTFT